MGNYAIVVGINRYDDPAVSILSTPVDDALHMAAWLLDPKKGQVPASNLFLLLDPIPDTSPPDVDLDVLRGFGNLRLATKRELLATPLDIDRIASHGGGRFYYYYAGHGMQSRITFSNEDAIVPANYAAGIEKAVSVSSLLRFFDALQFPEQYFFFDCCRDLALEDTDLDRVSPKHPDPTLPPRDQFVFNATAPGFRALDGRGMLTDLLLEGLGGAGAAKFWDSADRQYHVRVHRLFDYILQKFKAKLQQPIVGSAGGTTQIQVPRLGGEHTEDPTVVAFPESEIPVVDFAVTLEPPIAWPVADIRLEGDGIAQAQRGIPTSPFIFSIKPRPLAVRVQAPNWIPSNGKSFWILDVYEQTQLQVDFTPQAAVPLAAPGPVPTPLAPQPVPLAPVESPAPAAQAELPAAPGEVILTVPDSLVPLELLDSSGRAVKDIGGQALGLGSVRFQDLKPGIYRARLRIPEGEVVERAIRLDADRGIELSLSAPPSPVSGLLRDLIDHAKFHVGHDNLVELSERVGAVVAPALSTVLALASNATTQAASWGQSGHRLRAIGLDVFHKQPHANQPISSTFEVLLAVETEPGRADGAPVGASQVSKYLTDLELRLWPLGGTRGPAAHPQLSAAPGVATFSVPTNPGVYWFEIRATSGLSATFAVTVLEGRTTQLIFHQGADNQIQVSQFLPTSQPGNEADPTLLRQLDMAERFLLGSQLTPALATLEPLLEAPQLDPIAGCLGGYLLLRQRQLDRLAGLVTQMIKHYPGLSDAHVLRAVHRAAAGEGAAANAAARDALDCGLPFFAPCLEALAGLTPQSAQAHPRAELLKRIALRLVPGLLWTAWRPEEGWNGAS
jgi:hypothetical protein